MSNTTSSGSEGYEVDIKLKSADDRLKLGLTARCSIIEEEASNVFAVPYDAISQNTSGESVINISEGRHPMVEKALKGEAFVPNDTFLDGGENRTMMITGPNMAGKSTYMRQVALITLMAHLGSFVPASEAEISLVDRIFTRVGASDDLSAGQSTFMVEMS